MTVLNESLKESKLNEALKVIGLEWGEKFKLAGRKGYYVVSAFGDIVESNNGVITFTDIELKALFHNPSIIEHLPYQPKRGDGYYTVDVSTFSTAFAIWQDKPIDFMRKESGCIFKTLSECSEYVKEFKEKCFKGEINND